MENLGWITLHRKILDDNSSFRCLNLAQFFIAIQILLRANHSTREIIHRQTGEKLKIERGSLVVSQSGILDWFTPETRPDRQVVRTALKRLEKIGFLNQTTNQGLTILNVVNYSVYQTTSPQPNQTPNHELTSPKPDPNQHLTTNNNDNNVNNGNNAIIGAALESAAKPKKSPIGTRLPEDWQPDEALLAWARRERTDIDPLREAENFKDYWRAKTGKDATKLDWPATLRNWIRRVGVRASPPPPPLQPRNNRVVGNEDRKGGRLI